MDSVDVKEMLARKGWKLEESQENVELQKQVETLHEELKVHDMRSIEIREELEKRFQLEAQQHDILKQKYAYVKKQLTEKDKQGEEILGKFLNAQREAEMWKRKCEQRKIKSEELNEKLEVFHIFASKITTSFLTPSSSINKKDPNITSSLKKTNTEAKTTSTLNKRLHLSIKEHSKTFSLTKQSSSNSTSPTSKTSQITSQYVRSIKSLPQLSRSYHGQENKHLKTNHWSHYTSNDVMFGKLHQHQRYSVSTTNFTSPTATSSNKGQKYLTQRKAQKRTSVSFMHSQNQK